MVTLAGPRVVLRPIRKSDALDVYEQFKHPLMSQYIPMVSMPYKKRHAFEFVRNALKKIKEKRGLIWAITRKPSPKLIGIIEIPHPSKIHKRTDIGMWVAKEWQKKGIARETIYLVMKFLFERMHLHRVAATRYAHNEASRGLIESMGFNLEGILREFDFHRGKFHDVVVYSVLDREWPAVKRRLENRLGIAR